MLENILFFIGGAFMAGLIVWLFSRQKSAGQAEKLNLIENELENTRRDLASKTAQVEESKELIARLETTLENEKKRFDEQRELLEKARDELTNTFKALSSEALKSNNQSFLDLARATLEKFQTEARGDLDQRKQSIENMVKPIQDSLKNVNQQITDIEKSREGAYQALTQQVKDLLLSQDRLNKETSNLVTALRAPKVRGQWGEMQLRRVVEMAGMIDHCDFEKEVSVNTSDGRLRPDVVVNLPGGKQVIIDAKTPLEAYLNANETQDAEGKTARLKEHAAQVRQHINLLSSKSYFSQFDTAPEFVVMFLPGESFFSAALEQDPALIELGARQKVIPASPTTLIALLRAVAYGWQQERIAESAQKISNLGRELYDRIRTMADHFSDVGKNLDRSITSYNKAIGSLESRVLTSARRFTELGVDTGKEIASNEPLDKTSRKIQAGEMSENDTPTS